MGKIFSILLALVLALSFSLVAVPAAADPGPDIIEVSQPEQVTSNTYYERGQSIVYDGNNYWLFYGRSTTDDQPYATGSPDDSNYVLYYKKASSVSGLSPAIAQQVGNVTDVYQGQTSCAYYDSKVWVFYADDPSGDNHIEYFTYDGSSWSGPTDTGFTDVGGAPHLWATEYDGNLHIVYNADGSKLVGRHYDGSSWSSADDASTNEGMPRLYEDSQGDLLLTWCSWGMPAYYIHVYDSGWDTTADYTISGTENDDCDPWLFENPDGDYSLMFAPWDGTQQYISQWTASTLSGLNSATDYMVTQGSYTTSNPWVDMWPIVVEDGSDQYLFYTSERNPSDPLSEIAGNIWYLPVDWDMSHDHYTYIQNAVNAASSDDTIQVAAGTYGPFKVVDKTDLTIQSSSVVTVQGLQVVTTNYGDRDAVVFVSDSTNIVLDGLTIGPNTGKTKTEDYGVIYENSSGEINNCTVSPDTSGDMKSVAIATWDDSDVTIDPCTIEEFGGIGVFIQNGCTVDILGGSIEGQVYSGEGEVCYGIEVEGAYMDATPGTGSHVIIDGVEIYNCDNTFATGPSWASGGVYINGWMEYCNEDDSTVIVENCDIHDNYIGIIAVNSSLSFAHSNNIYDNRDYGVESAAAYDASTAVFDALYNWWGHKTGPDHDTRNPGGQGDAVSDNVDFSPWLYKTQEEFVSGAPCYAGSVVLANEATWVEPASHFGGWNSFSTPIALDSSANTVSELLALAAESDLFILRAQRFDPATQQWVRLILNNTMMAPDYQIKPGEGFYIQVKSKGSLPILVKTDTTQPPMRKLDAGWNLIGLSSLGEETVDTALTGVDCSMVLSPKPPNDVAWSVPPAVATAEKLLLGKAYWVAMGEPGILYGFTYTPVADDMTWELNQ